MRKIIAISLAALAAAGTYSLCAPRATGPTDLNLDEAHLAYGGLPFQECSHIGPCSYKNCTWVPAASEWIKSRPNSAKECDWADFTICGNGLKTTCYYDHYSDSACTIYTGTTSSNEDVCHL